MSSKRKLEAPLRIDIPRPSPLFEPLPAPSSKNSKNSYYAFLQIKPCDHVFTNKNV